MSYNRFSALGRLSYFNHLLFYPGAVALYVFVLKPWYNKWQQDTAEKEWQTKPKAKPVDPDLFNPFSAIPYHNNPELKYQYATVKMHNYVNKNHLNTN